MRRRAILDTAAAMLAEMPVADVTLNELSRRVGLAKSNVLRYFESREAVLLDLLGSQWQEWLAALAGALAASLNSRPVLCDLVSAQAAVLERNVSPQVAAAHKRATIAGLTDLGELLRGHLGELSEPDATRLAAAALVTTGALWPQCQPSPAMRAAYEADPALAALRLDFAPALREFLEVFISGTLARAR